MGTLTPNYSYMMPDDKGDTNEWGSAYANPADANSQPSPGYNGNWQKADVQFQALEYRLTALENAGIGGRLVEQFYTVINMNYTNSGYRILNDIQQDFGILSTEQSVTRDPSVLPYPVAFAAGNTPYLSVTSYAVSSQRYPMVAAFNYGVDSAEVYAMLGSGSVPGGPLNWMAIGVPS